MSTRSRIAIKNNDGTYTSIYCHFDGYIEGVGSVLHDFYSEESKVRELMEGGDTSSFEDSGFANTYRGYGETDVDAIVHEDFDDLKRYFESFNYIFDNGKWYVCSRNFDSMKELSIFFD